MFTGDALCQTIRNNSLNTKRCSSHVNDKLEHDTRDRSNGTRWMRDIRELYEQMRIKMEREYDIDLDRCFRFGIIGATLHGPWFLIGFRVIDTTFGPSKSIQTAAAKMASGQFTVFPVYLLTFFYYMGFLEGLNHEERVHKVEKGFLPTFAGGTAFWPIVNMFNFTLVPSSHRILYVNIMGLFWNAYLSYSNATTASAESFKNR